jgi:hypothetical protein
MRATGDLHPPFTPTFAREAEVVCFLRFGFNSTNLKRLSIPDTILRKFFVAGSALYLSGSKRATVGAFFGPGQTELADATCDCLDTLWKLYILREA